MKIGAMCVCGVGLFVSSADAQFDGRWEGFWFNDTFGSSGAMVSDVEVVGQMLTITTDLDGFVFGFLNPPPFTMTATVGLDGTVVFDSAGGFFSAADGTFDGTNFAFNLFDAAGGSAMGGFDLVTLSGTVIGDEFRADYRLFDGVNDTTPFAEGRVELDRVPAPGSAALLGMGVFAGLRRRTR